MTMTEQPQPLTAPEYIAFTHLAASAIPSTEWEVACERAARDEDGKALGFRPSCACNGEGKAEWVLWRGCSCDPHYLLYCTLCKDHLVNFSGPLKCGSCGRLSFPASTAYTLIEPLNKRQP